MNIEHNQLSHLLIGVFYSGIFFFACISGIVLKENLKASFAPFTLLTFIFSWYYFWISIINAGILPHDSFLFGLNMLFTGYGGPLVFLLSLSVAGKTVFIPRKYYLLLLFGLVGTVIYILIQTDPAFYLTAYNYYTKEQADYSNILGFLYLVHSAIQAIFLLISLAVLVKNVLKKNISINEKKASLYILIAILAIFIAYMNSNILLYFFRIMEAKYIAPLVGLPTMALLFYALMLNRRQFVKSREILHKNIAFEEELRYARRIQQSIIPHEDPVSNKYRIVSKYIPLAQVGGDFYDFIKGSGNSIGIYLADVSGHGIPAAFIASMIKIALIANKDKADKPDELFHEISGMLRNNLKEQFFTANYVLLDFDRGVMKMANAGHLPLITINKETGQILEHNPEGTYVGPLFHKKFESREVPFQHGDRLLFFTDGVVECHNAEKKLYGISRLKQLLIETLDVSVSEVSDRIFESLKSWSHSLDGFDDDVTYIIVDIL